MHSLTIGNPGQCLRQRLECEQCLLSLTRPPSKKNFAALPLSTYQAGETVIADGSRTGRLLILKKGTVAIVKQGTEIAKVAEPGAVFGELSVLLD